MNPNQTRSGNWNDSTTSSLLDSNKTGGALYESNPLTIEFAFASVRFSPTVYEIVTSSSLEISPKENFIIGSS